MKKKGKNRETRFYTGMAAMLLFMIGDWLLDVKGAGNQEIGVFVNTNWQKMSMWRFEASILLAAVAQPLYWIGIQGMQELVRERCMQQESCMQNQTKHSARMHKIFRVGSMSCVLSCLFIHIMCCLMPIICKTVFAYQGDFQMAADITNELGIYIIAPFMVYYLVADVGISIATGYLVISQRLKVPKWMVVFNPLGGLVLCEILTSIPYDWCHDLAAATESFGHLLMFAVGLYAVKCSNKMQQ